MKEDLFKVFEKEVNELRSIKLEVDDFVFKILPNFEIYHFCLKIGRITVIYDVFQNKVFLEHLNDLAYEKISADTIKDFIVNSEDFYSDETSEMWHHAKSYPTHEARVSKASMLDWYSFLVDYEDSHIITVDFLVFLIEEPKNLIIEISKMGLENPDFVGNFVRENREMVYMGIHDSSNYGIVMKNKNAKNLCKILEINEKQLSVLLRNSQILSKMGGNFYDLFFESDEGLESLESNTFKELFNLQSEDKFEIAYFPNHFLRRVQYAQYLKGADEKSFEKMFTMLLFNEMFKDAPSLSFISPQTIHLKNLKILTERFWAEFKKIKKMIKRITIHLKNKDLLDLLGSFKAVLTMEERLAKKSGDPDAAFILIYSSIFLQSGFSLLYRQIMETAKNQKVSIEEAFDICYHEIKKRSSYKFKGVFEKYLSFSRALGDYIEMYQELEGKESIAAFPAIPKNLLEIKKYHDDLSYIYGVEKDKEISQMNLTLNYERNKQYEYTGNEFSIVVPKTGVEIISEAIALRHCVRAYAEAAQKGKTNLLFLRKTNNLKKPLVTIELSNNKKVVQAHGTSNRLLKDNEQSFLEEWSKEFGIAL